MSAAARPALLCGGSGGLLRVPVGRLVGRWGILRIQGGAGVAVVAVAQHRAAKSAHQAMARNTSCDCFSTGMVRALGAGLVD